MYFYREEGVEDVEEQLIDSSRFAPLDQRVISTLQK